MRSIITLFWKNKILLLLLVLTVVYVVYRLTLSEEGVSLKPGASPTPTPVTAVFKSFIAGSDSKEDIEKVLGKPKKEEDNLSFYSSKSPNRDHQVTYEEERAAFAKEIVTAQDNKKMKDLTRLYGEPEATLYNETSQDSGFNLYVYPKEGVAAYAGGGETIIELWYFAPTNIEEFQSKWAPDFSFEMPPPPKDRY